MQGWILDVYPGKPGEMVVWLKLENGGTRRFVDRWTPSIFVAAPSRSDLIDLEKRASGGVPGFSWSRFVRKYEKITDEEESEVLEVVVRDARKTVELAKGIELFKPFGQYRLYNVDVPPDQMYFYGNGLFPLALCDLTERDGELSWKLLDDEWDCGYRVPDLRWVKIEVSVRSEMGRLAKVSDPIEAIRVKWRGEEGSEEEEEEEVIEEGGSEREKILGLVRKIEEIDPDIVFTRDGDGFVLPYLFRRAEQNGIADELRMDRDGNVLRLPQKKGTSYFSYGKILYKPSAMRLEGRIHIDLSNSFVCNETGGVEGMYEVSRICRLPLQTASRASIGKALSSLQFYHASRRGILIPWKPSLAEHFKSRAELLVADRGGFVFEPQLGLHEEVGELDFNSLYPNIMLKKNISAETVKCSCCPDSLNRIPELDWNVCTRKEGIIPRAVEIIVEKRLRYKQLTNKAGVKERSIYEARKTALKWIGVATFGYLGFNNAKFGRIDAHIGVCAWDRKVLLGAAEIAEKKGYRLMHGIVDSLWLKKEGASKEDYEELAREIEAETGFGLSFEGIYNWIAFLPSKVNASVPVLNRYFGAYGDGDLKVRGIEARRHDTPPIFSRLQMEILNLLSRASNIEEGRGMMRDCIDTFLRYAKAILDQRVPVEEMVFTRNLSKKPDEYKSRTLLSSVAKRLVQEEGMELHAGESVRYVIRDYESRSATRRAIPVDLLRQVTDGGTLYDGERYVELLAEACATVLERFRPDCGADGLMRRVRSQLQHGERPES